MCTKHAKYVVIYTSIQYKSVYTIYASIYKYILYFQSLMSWYSAPSNYSSTYLYVFVCLYYILGHLGMYWTIFGCAWQACRKTSWLLVAFTYTLIHNQTLLFFGGFATTAGRHTARLRWQLWSRLSTPFLRGGGGRHSSIRGSCHRCQYPRSRHDETSV